MIIGLQAKLDEQIGYVSKIGSTHLADNEFLKKKQYDELDVMCFDRNRFAQNLFTNEEEEEIKEFHFRR